MNVWKRKQCKAGVDLFLLCINEIPAERVVGSVHWRGPTRVNDCGYLPFVNSLRSHLHIKPLVDFHCYIGITGKRGVEASVLVWDHSHMVLSVARWRILSHNAVTKDHTWELEKE